MNNTDKQMEVDQNSIESEDLKKLIHTLEENDDLE